MILRLEFKHVFPDEEEKDILDYLKQISSLTLLNIIGFSNTYPQPNFDNFYSNLEARADIIDRVSKHCYKNGFTDKPSVISREGSLRLAEIILSNRNELIEKKQNYDNDTNEINLFKSYLVINNDLNTKFKLKDSKDNFEKLVDISIAVMFKTSDIGLFEENDYEFSKFLYASIVRFELLLKFLQSKNEYQYLETGLYSHFQQSSSKDLTFQVKMLFRTLLKLKINNSFKFEVDDIKF